jgi:hypothetical protein
MKKFGLVLTTAALCCLSCAAFAAEKADAHVLPCWQENIIQEEAMIGQGATVNKDNDNNTGIGHGVIVNDNNKKTPEYRGHGPAQKPDNNNNNNGNNNNNNQHKFNPRGHGPSVNGDNDNTIKTDRNYRHHRHHGYRNESEKDYIENKDDIQDNTDYQQWRMRRNKPVIAHNEH